MATPADPTGSVNPAISNDPASSATPVDPDALAKAALSCRSVARMSGGAFGEAATYLPGRRVPGIRVVDDVVAVHVVGVFGPPVPRIADEVRAAVAPLVGERRVDVVVEDLDLGGPQHDGQPESRAGSHPVTYGTYYQGS